MGKSPTLVNFVRTSRPDTVHVRMLVPQIQSMVGAYILLEGVECIPEAKEEIDNWIEARNGGDHLELVTPDFFRDTYGRVLGDLKDRSTGAMLTRHLLEVGVAEEKPNHYIELLREMLSSGGEF